MKSCAQVKITFHFYENTATLFREKRRSDDGGAVVRGHTNGSKKGWPMKFPQKPSRNEAILRKNRNWKAES